MFFGRNPCYDVAMSTKPRFLVAVVDRRVDSHVQIWNGLCEAAAAGDWPHAIEEIRDMRDLKTDAETCMGMVSWFSSGSTGSFPFPLINFSSAKGPLPGCGNLLNDDAAVGREAAKHLLQSGYRHYVGLGVPGKQFSRDRLRAFAETVRDKGQPLTEVDLPEPKPGTRNENWNSQAFMESMAEALTPHLRDLPPDAGVFTVDHPLAQLVEHCLFTRFPERVHTTGLLSGDLPVAFRWLPGQRRSISFVRTANKAKGRAAMEWFMRHGRDKRAVADLCRLFPPEGVLEQASTAGPACGHPQTARGIRWSWERIQSGAPPTVQELASFMNMSSRNLNRQFQRELDTTARDFLLNLRMERAAQMLLSHPDLLIQRVAEEAGFSNQSTFSSAFQTWSGQQPRAYRKSKKAQGMS